MLETSQKLSKKFEEIEKLRMTNWEDLKTEQQIERMREVVNGLQSSIRSMRDILDSIDNGFEKHSHSNGKLVIDYDRYRGRGCGSITGVRQTQNFF